MAGEREVKTGAWAGFELPDLTGVATEVTPVARATLVLDAVYDDTPDMKPARWAITARHRSGEGSSARTLKLPGGDDGPAPVGRVFGFKGPARQVPGAACTLLVPDVRITAWSRWPT